MRIFRFKASTILIIKVVETESPQKLTAPQTAILVLLVRQHIKHPRLLFLLIQHYPQMQLPIKHPLRLTFRQERTERNWWKRGKKFEEEDPTPPRPFRPLVSLNPNPYDSANSTFRSHLAATDRMASSPIGPSATSATYESMSASFTSSTSCSTCACSSSRQAAAIYCSTCSADGG